MTITYDLLLDAYRCGVFPMAEDADSSDIMWIEPEMRGLIPLDAFHVPRSLKKVIRKAPFTITINECFADVIAACANRQTTWINQMIKNLYIDLHKDHHAHSVEVWKDDTLVGGLYGVHINSAFFGESMFSTATNASKVALVYLVARLKAGGFKLLDTQFTTQHLQKFGTLAVPKATYKRLLQHALGYPGDFFALHESVSPEEVLQLSSQTS